MRHFIITLALFFSSVVLADYDNSTKYPDTDCVLGNRVLIVDGVVQSPGYSADHTAENEARKLSQKLKKTVLVRTPDKVCSTVWRNNPTYSASSASSSVASSVPASSSSAAASSVQSSAVSSTPAGSWVVRADFEKTVGTVATGADAFTGGATKATISDEIPAVSGSRVARVHIPAGCGGCFGTWGGIIDFPTPLKKGDEVRIKLSVYWPSTFNTDANPWLKFLRVRTLQSNGQNGGYDDIYIPVKTDAHAFQFIYEGEQVWNRFGETADKVQYNVWETYEYYIKFDSVPASQGGMAVVEFWKNGVRLAQLKDRRTLNDTWTANNFYLFTYWNGENAPAQHVYVDDITVTGTRN